MADRASIWYRLWSMFLIWLSKVKVLKFGMIPVLAQDFDPYVVTGHDILNVMDLIQPGDVLLRGFDRFLDGRFIPDELGYSHAGLYIGWNEVVHAANPIVQSISIVDFCQCDRIMVLRPKSGAEDAVKRAMSKLGVSYDFNYDTDVGRMYCFELIAHAYPEAEMKTHNVSKFLGLVKRDCYLAESIYGNSFFKVVYERNNKTKGSGC